jgi:type IV pilus assembly protein PilF
MNYMKLPAVLITVLLLAGCAGTSVEDSAEKRAMAARANTQLGIEYLRQGKNDLARQRLEKALELEPTYAEAHGIMALLYEQVGQLEQAEEHFRRSLRLDPDNAGVHNNYGQFLCNRKQFDKAEEQFKAAAAQPFYATPYLPLLNAGVCMASVPDVARAEQYYRAALEKRPDFGLALLKMAELNFQQQNYLSARAYLQRLHHAGTYTPESLWLGVRTEYALGDHQAWGNYALTLRSKFPGSKEATLLVEWENERLSGN